MADEPRPMIPISADWVLKRIQEGKNVRLRNAVIEGDLDLSKLSLPTERIERTEVQKQNGWVEDVKIVKSSIAIINSVIQGELNFSNSTFIYVDFQDTKFIKDVNFQDSKFSGYAKFEGTQFGGEAGFSVVQFSEEADFMGAKFSGYTTFQDAQFSYFAKFCGAQFSECPYFERTKFRGETDFMSAKFSDASFTGALFSSYAYFHSVQFSGEAFFRGAQFSGYANFIEAKFNGDVNFVHAQFNDDANFLSAEIKKTINLDHMKCDRFYVSWKTLKGHLVYDGATYLSIVKNFRNLEQFGDADSCYYQYRKESQTKKNWYDPPNKIINFFIQIHGRIAQHLKWIIDLYNWLNKKPPLLWIHRFPWKTT